MPPSKKKQADSRVRTVRIPWALDSVPEIRRVLVEDLAASAVPQKVIDEAETVACELVANAVRHGKALPDGTVRVHWKVRGGRVELEVTDGGGGVPAPKPVATWAPAGRGLRIVRSIAHEWGVTEERQGQTVWAALGGPSRRRA